MAPDLNSLPLSRASSSSITTTPAMSMARALNTTTEAGVALRSQTPSPSSRSTSTSLQAAAVVNAGLQHEDSRRASNGSINRSRQSPHAGRRRSAVLMNIQLNDPGLPAPGEMIMENQISSYRTSSPQSLAGSPIISTGDPHHFLTPSLGEIHQELEQEQEAQVNRLLQMIRAQQQQLQQLQAASGQSHTPTAIDDSTPTSERSMSFSTPSNAVPLTNAGTTVTPRSPSTTLPLPRSSVDLVRPDVIRQSRTPSRTASPRLRSTSISGEGGEGWSLGGRDESAFYQAEVQMVTRENQMLRMRIRELERQVSECHSNSAITNEPAVPSNLTRTQSSPEEQPLIPGGFPVAIDGSKDE